MWWLFLGATPRSTTVVLAVDGVNAYALLKPSTSA
jgi:hypothetical protein